MLGYSMETASRDIQCFRKIETDSAKFCMLSNGYILPHILCFYVLSGSPGAS